MSEATPHGTVERGRLLLAGFTESVCEPKEAVRYLGTDAENITHASQLLKDFSA